MTSTAGDVVSVAFSPDGRTMATGNVGNKVQLWDVRDIRAPQPITDANSPSVAFAVAFSPGGHTLAAGKADGTTELWDITDPHHPQGPITLTGPASGGYSAGSVAFSSNNHVLAAAGALQVAPDRSVRLWDTDTERVAARICELAWPAITPAEWAQYFPGIAYQPPCP